MDRNDSNPGMVERQLDETPMEGRSMESDEGGMSGADRDSLQRDGSTEREGMQDGSVEREGMQGSEGMERDSMTDGGSQGSEMRGSSSSDQDLPGAREGGYGYDRPADLTVGRDTMEGSSRDTDQGTDRAPRVSDTDSPDQPTGTTTARDW